MIRTKNTRKWETVSEVSLVYNPHVKPACRPRVKGPEDIYELMLGRWDQGLINVQEEAKLLLLNADSRVLGISNLGMGGLSCVVIDPRLVFAKAISCLATSIVLCHNHPSGNVKPSKADIRITEKIKHGARLLDIELLDHLIITSDNFYSFGEAGLL